MTIVRMVVNGRAVSEDVPARLHLADFVRERLLLTGTHLGCEHGVCGACTILLNGEPARSCIAYAAACDGADVCTIEGLADDAVMVRLRAAFTAQHALQCGYCTPGMLVTARDIVMRLPDADDDTIRLELAGNLCRCTGYNGIVRAIRQVLNERVVFRPVVRPRVSAARFGDVAVERVLEPAGPGGGLHQRLSFDVTPEVLWSLVRDPALMVACVPGAVLLSVEGEVIEGEMVVALGPVRARFRGRATLQTDDAARSGVIAGGGQDQLSGTRLTASAPFRVLAEGDGAALVVDIAFSLQGPLAQLAKGRVVDLVADEIAGSFARTLAARLAGEAAPAAVPLSGFRLAMRLVVAWVRGLRG
jgi:carbon-monoxide dehydrogenase small subunit